MTRFCCFGSGPSADGAKTQRKGRRRRHKQPSTIPSLASNGTSANGLSGAHGSGGPMNGTGFHEIHLIDTPLNERTLDSDGEDFCSCRDDFSVTDGSHLDNAHLSPRGSVPQSPNNLKARSLSAADAQPDTSNQHQPAHLHLPSHPINQQQQAPDLQGASETETDSDIGGEGARRGFGCLHLLDSLNIGGNASTRHLEPQISPVKPSIGHGNKRGPGEKPEPGVSMQLRDMSQAGTDVSYCYQDASDSKFNLRGIDYMKTKVKVPSVPAMYQLFAADIFAMPKKQYHIAKYLNLPNHPPVMAGDVALPPVMIFNIQLPLYLATLFGPQDGEGVSIVFYFKLPEDFDPAKFENQKALDLFKRFVSNGREADGSPTRDRLKLIPRVVNVDEWIKKGPLSQAEAKILVSYNDKPILSRPQHMFYSGRGYMEVDLDCHQYTFLARRAISNYLARLPLVVWENAFVVQGNSPDELPEQLIGVARVYRFDFKQAKPLPSPVQRESVSVGTGTGTGQGETPASPTASTP